MNPRWDRRWGLGAFALFLGLLLVWILAALQLIPASADPRYLPFSLLSHRPADYGADERRPPLAALRLSSVGEALRDQGLSQGEAEQRQEGIEASLRVAVPTATAYGFGGTPTMIPTPLPSATPTRTAEATPTPLLTGTTSPTASVTSTETRTATRTPTRTGTRVATRTAARTATGTGTWTPTSTPTGTEIGTPTSTSTPSPTATTELSPTPTAAPTSTPTPLSGIDTVPPSIEQMTMDPPPGTLGQCHIDVTLMYVVDPAPSSGVNPGNVVFYYEYPPGVRSAPFGPTSVVTQMIQQEFRGSYGGRITITGVTLEAGSAGGRFPAAATSATIGVYGEVVDNAGNGATTGPYYYTLTVSCEQAP